MLILYPWKDVYTVWSSFNCNFFLHSWTFQRVRVSQKWEVQFQEFCVRLEWDVKRWGHKDWCYKWPNLIEESVEGQFQLKFTVKEMFRKELGRKMRIGVVYPKKDHSFPRRYRDVLWYCRLKINVDVVLSKMGWGSWHW